MRARKQEKFPVTTSDDADAAAGLVKKMLPSPPVSRGAMSDLEFFEDLVSEPVLVLGVDISHLPRRSQFISVATGNFGFSLLYGFLQELLSVQLCSRNLGLFLAMIQFIGYTVLAFLMRTYVYESQKRKKMKMEPRLTAKTSSASLPTSSHPLQVPFRLYLGLSLLRALDLGMTNMAMQYINYPAKTLMKSSRVVFTMLFGVIITNKTYKWADYFVVLCMVAGLAIFMHADANSSAIFQPLGVIMLVSKIPTSIYFHLIWNRLV
jgi:drug/metabolite transporter (DMT)-like permease